MMRFLLILVLLPLAGCSYLFPNESLQYLETEASAPVKAPADVTLNEQQRYPVPAPAVAENLPEKFIVPSPDRLPESAEEDDRVTSLILVAK